MLRISLAYVSPDLRPILQSLYGLLATIEECLYRASDPVVSSAKLAWWYEELQQAKRGRSNHPLSLQFESSGALAVWPDASIERLFKLAVRRVEAEGVNNESELQQLCESLGMIHLELEAGLQSDSAPDQRVIVHLAASNGLMQLLKGSYEASKPNYYWVPLSDCARLGIDRLQMAENVFAPNVRQVTGDIAKRILVHSGMLPNSKLFSELPSSLSANCRHWLLLSLLQQRQLFRLQNELANPTSADHYSKHLRQVNLSDGWFAWRAARQLDATGKDRTQ